MDCKHPLISKFRKYQNIPRKISIKSIFQDEDCFIMAKISAPYNNSYGYSISKYCKKCHDNDSSDTHHYRLVACNNSQQFSIYSAKQIKFLLEEVGATIDEVIHCWKYVPSVDYKNYATKMLHLRTMCKKNSLKTLSILLKNTLNGGVGKFAVKSDHI